MKKMKKLIMLVVCAVILTAALAACSNSNPVTVPSLETEPPQQIDDHIDEPAENSDDHNEANSEPALFTMEMDMGVNVNGQWFPIWEDVGGLLQTLGDDYEMTSAPSCVFEGEDKEFAFDDYFVFTNPDGDRDLWYSIYIIGGVHSTARGIRVGSAVDDVIAAYGDNFYREGDNIITFSISGVEGDIASPCIQFTVEDERVAEIEIYYPTNVS